MSEMLNTIKLKREQAHKGGGQQRIDKQHESGKLTARERIEVLVDPYSFEEMYTFVESPPSKLQSKIIPGDGVVTGKATINGKVVFVYSQDFTVLGGSVSKMHAEKICKLYDMAAKVGAPIIGMNDSGGARIQEGVDSLSGYGEIFQRNVDYSGVIPQIAVIMGPCAGGAVYSPALMDFIFMVRKTSYMYVTGPAVVKAVNFENTDHESLGGADVHAKTTGVADCMFDNEIECLQQVRRFMSFLPASNRVEPPFFPSQDSSNRVESTMENLVPDDPNKPYDMHILIKKLVDEEDFMEIKAFHAQNIITGFVRLEGHVTGIIANQPMHKAGCLDIDASLKAARFIRFCDAFNIPLLTIVDVPGFMPGLQQEHNGIIKHGAKMLYAYAEATVPKITLVVRKAYGGAYIVMNSKHLRGDVNYAWPNTEIAVMGAKEAAAILYRNLETEELEEKIASYKAEFSTPLFSASKGYIDDVIRPFHTRYRICNAFAMLRNKTTPQAYYKKHSNLPL